jgi:hypothetical protein
LVSLSVIRSGVKLAPNTFVAAGALVTSDTEENAVYKGVPARKQQITADEISRELDLDLLDRAGIDLVGKLCGCIGIWPEPLGEPLVAAAGNVDFGESDLTKPVGNHLIGNPGLQERKQDRCLIALTVANGIFHFLALPAHAESYSGTLHV